jgi:HD-GYP domain-containing protein (c-di-GMP phosphodiesterase class II)
LVQFFYVLNGKDLELEDYILVRKTQIPNYIKTPLYILNADTGYILYKPINKKLDNTQFSRDSFPNLYINKNDKGNATNELRAELKKKLSEKIERGDIKEVKNEICEIVGEIFSGPVEESIEILPETIDIVYEGYSKAADLLKEFSDIHYAGYSLINHSVNVMALALLYCLKNGFHEHKTKQISLCALLHDVGITKLPKGIVSYSGSLSDQNFNEYQTHAFIGHDIVKENENVDSSIAIGILEHHERLDGSGYPRGIVNITFEGRLIGLINSFDHLTNSEKIHRQKKKPFDAMMVIKDEVLKKGQFDKKIFKNLCLSLGKKTY